MLALISSPGYASDEHDSFFNLGDIVEFEDTPSGGRHGKAESKPEHYNDMDASEEYYNADAGNREQGAEEDDFDLGDIVEYDPSEPEQKRSEDHAPLGHNDVRVHGLWMVADVLVYDVDNPNRKEKKCSSGEANIGSCIIFGKNKNEKYLCDPFTNEIYISLCENDDCTNCGAPQPNWYGYVNGKCQDNGWLKAICTGLTWEDEAALVGEMHDEL